MEDLEHGRPDPVELRRASLVQARYDPETADALARRTDIPLQEAVAVRWSGLPPDVAFALMTSGDRPVLYRWLVTPARLGSSAGGSYQEYA